MGPRKSVNFPWTEKQLNIHPGPNFVPPEKRIPFVQRRGSTVYLALLHLYVTQLCFKTNVLKSKWRKWDTNTVQLQIKIHKTFYRSIKYASTYSTKIQFSVTTLNVSSWRFMKRTIESKSDQGGFSSIIVLYICGYPLTTSTPNGFGICIKEILFGFNFTFNLIFSYL